MVLPLVAKCIMCLSAVSRVAVSCVYSGAPWEGGQEWQLLPIPLHCTLPQLLHSLHSTLPQLPCSQSCSPAGILGGVWAEQPRGRAGTGAVKDPCCCHFLLWQLPGHAERDTSPPARIDSLCSVLEWHRQVLSSALCGLMDWAWKAPRGVPGERCCPVTSTSAFPLLCAKCTAPCSPVGK